MKLTLSKIMQIMRTVEKNDRWFFSVRNACAIADINDVKTVIKDLEYYVESDMIEHVGEDIYAFRIFSMVPCDAQEILTGALRPNDLNYVSFEYALNQYGIISQIPTVLTVATTGDDGLYESPSYRIEFNHVDHDFRKIMENCSLLGNSILMASPEFAVGDLMFIGRNTHLIQEEEILEAQEFYKNQQNR